MFIWQKSYLYQYVPRVLMLICTVRCLSKVLKCSIKSVKLCTIVIITVRNVKRYNTSLLRTVYFPIQRECLRTCFKVKNKVVINSVLIAYKYMAEKMKWYHRKGTTKEISTLWVHYGTLSCTLQIVIHMTFAICEVPFTPHIRESALMSLRQLRAGTGHETTAFRMGAT